jgi:hypothetical protein
MPLTSPISSQRAMVLGQAPPTGLTGDLWRTIGPPVIDGKDADWDIMRETLWVHSLTALILDVGTDRTAAAGLPAGASFSVVDYRHLGYKAGRPVVELISKGWRKTKTDKWAFRRSIAGDATNGLVNGFAYTIRTYFSATLPTGKYVNAVAPSVRWGYGAEVWTPTYGSTWPYFPTGDASGWLLASREVEQLTGTTICKVVDSYAYDNLNTGT